MLVRVALLLIAILTNKQQIELLFLRACVEQPTYSGMVCVCSVSVCPAVSFDLALIFTLQTHTYTRTGVSPAVSMSEENSPGGGGDFWDHGPVMTSKEKNEPLATNWV